MLLINSRAEAVEDCWTYLESATDPALHEFAVVPLSTLIALGVTGSQPAALGVYAPAGTAAENLGPYLPRLQLVVVEFPKFRDGRGFTLARTLREKHGFQGDIRASGHVLPDQFAALVQCGVSTIRLPVDHPLEQWSQIRSAGSRSAKSGPLLKRLLADREAERGENSAACTRRPQTPISSEGS